MQIQERPLNDSGAICSVNGVMKSLGHQVSENEEKSVKERGSGCQAD